MNLFCGLLLVMALVARQTDEPSTENAAEHPQRNLLADATADELIEQIETRLKIGRSSLPFDKFRRNHQEIATLVAQLQRAYPDDARVAAYLPKRWLSLSTLTNHANPVGRQELFDELAKTIRTTSNSRLKQDALFMQTVFHMHGSVDGPKPQRLREISHANLRMMVAQVSCTFKRSRSWKLPSIRERYCASYWSLYVAGSHFHGANALLWVGGRVFMPDWSRS